MTTTGRRRTAWPEEETIPLKHHELSQPLADAVRSAYELRRKDRDQDIPWTGPEGGGAETIGGATTAWWCTTYPKHQTQETLAEELALGNPTD